MLSDITLKANMSFQFIHQLRTPGFWSSWPGDEKRPPFSGDGFILADHYVLSDVQVILTYYDGVVALEGTPCLYYLEKRSLFYSKLSPSKDARDLVNEIIRNYFDDRIIIGIHFRAHDPRIDWEVVPPLGGVGGGKAAMRFGEGATIEDFIRTMQLIDAKFSTPDSRGVIYRRHRFFIASNSDDVKQEFLRHFPDSVTLSGDYR